MQQQKTLVVTLNLKSSAVLIWAPKICIKRLHAKHGCRLCIVGLRGEKSRMPQAKHRFTLKNVAPKVLRTNPKRYEPEGSPYLP